MRCKIKTHKNIRKELRCVKIDKVLKISLSKNPVKIEKDSYLLLFLLNYKKYINSSYTRF